MSNADKGVDTTALPPEEPVNTDSVGESPIEDGRNESYYVASSWQLIWRSFIKHKLALVGGGVLVAMYLVGVVFTGFFSTYPVAERHADYAFVPPQRIRIFHEGRLHVPFVYGLEKERDPETWRITYTNDKSQVYPVRFFSRGFDYKLWGFIPTNIHLVSVEEPGTLFLFGTDVFGRDLFSRTITAARISLTIGLIGVAISFILGNIMGGLAGYFGGWVDMMIMRIVEFLGSLPTLPIWMALAAVVPRDWPIVRTYFMITVILSIIGWTGMARTIRGKLLQLRVEDYVMAAKIAGAREGRIISRHLLPGFMSWLIVNMTLAIPRMILGETALSFIGVGLRAPAVSWGTLLQDAQNVRTVATNPWLMLPALFVIVTVLSFNLMGDGLRDAADPYK